MRKLLTFIAILTMAFTSCEQPVNEGKPDPKLPNLTIRNQSSFVLTNGRFSDISLQSPVIEDQTRTGVEDIYILKMNKDGTMD